MFKNANILLLFVVMALFSSSCSGYQKLLKSTDPVLKLEKAKEYFASGDYFKALQLFDELVIIYRGRPESEQISYYYSYCYYNQKQYLIASYNFKDFVHKFPQSDLAEECMYMSAYCKYLLSPKYSLDQQSTYEALREMQLFLDLFPKSERVASSNELIDKLRSKLEKKDFETAKLYYSTEYYFSAIYALNTFLKTYPSSSYKEESMAMIAKANIAYAAGSVAEKQRDRYKAALEASNDYLAHFPNGKWASQMKGIERDSKKFLEN